MYAKFGLGNAPGRILPRLIGIIAFDPLASTVDDHARRHTGVGELWLRGGITAILEGSRRPKIDLQYGVKVPTASAEQGLGSGEVDHRVVVALDKTWAGDVWSNLTFAGTFKGSAQGGSTEKVARVVGQLELPLRSQVRWAVAYQGYLQVDTPFTDADLSSFQQHGGAIQIGMSLLWIGGGVSLGRAGSEWNPGGYLRVEWRP